MLAAPNTERFESLDVLRGVAVLGIFAINIQAMALPSMLFGNPSLNTQFFDAQGQAVWSIASMFFQFKFITIFSALFGAGIMLMVGEEKPSERSRIHRRRMLWLLLLGSLHAYLIWFGDILVPYALAGFLVVFARRWRARTLFIVGLLLMSLTYLAFLGQYVFFESASPEELEEFLSQMWSPPQDVIDAEIAKYQLGFFERIPATAPTAVLFQMVQSLLMGPRTIGIMMCGMALYKLGFFTLAWSTGRYLVTGLIALVIGLAGSAYATSSFFTAEFDMLQLGPAQGAQYWASLPQAFGYAALIMAACKLSAFAWARRPFAAAGRMALTNYLMCSIIGAFLYYGAPGLGQIGAVSYQDQAVTMLITWLAILIWSPIWLSFFRFGPFEWLWRSLTYWHRQPMLKSS